ncbi:MAG: hypothetical protein AB1Z98_13610 [Nannocystaceae bacterium]
MKRPSISLSSAAWAALARLLLTAALVMAPTLANASGPRYAPIKLTTNFEDEDPERTQRIRPVLEQSTIDALRRHEIDVVESADAELVIYVRSLAEESGTGPQVAVIDYAVVVEVRLGDEQATKHPFFCAKKGEAELIMCVLEGITPALEALPVESRPDEPHGKPPSEGGGGLVHPQPARIRPIGGLGITGIVVGAGGLATTVAAAVDLRRGERVDEPTSAGLTNTTDFRPRGRALLGVGLGLLVTGAVLVGVDVGLRAKKRKRRAVDVGFGLAPSFTGASVRGRF